MFVVYYKDDQNRMHITVANTYAELKFVQERFTVTDYHLTKQEAAVCGW